MASEEKLPGKQNRCGYDSCLDAHKHFCFTSQFDIILLCGERFNKEINPKTTKQLPQTFTVENSPFTPSNLGITTRPPQLHSENQRLTWL